eukprot:SAG31_NODE_5063_length_2763_cov_8.216967_5_plen_49_part_00
MIEAMGVDRVICVDLVRDRPQLYILVSGDYGGSSSSSYGSRSTVASYE